MQGKLFTYVTDNGDKKSKIDRVLVTPDLMNLWPTASFIALPRSLSDHRPLVLITSNTDFGPIPFKFFNSWLQKPGLNEVITNSLTSNFHHGKPDQILQMKLKKLKQDLKEWLRSNVNQEEQEKEALIDQLKDLDDIVDHRDYVEDELALWTETKGKLLSQVGNGANIRLWIDKWIGEEPLCNTFPALFKLERHKDCVIKDRCTGNGQFSQWEWEWISPPASTTELYQLQEMLSQLRNVILTNDTDTWKWACNATGIFTTKSMKNHLIKTAHGPNHWIFPWNRLAPIKANILGWRLEMNRLPTTDLLLQRKIAIPSTTCLLCNTSVESIQHLFLECPFADILWSLMLSWCKIPLRRPLQAKDLFELHMDPSIPPNKAKHINLVVLSYCWTIWKVRNERVFSNKEPSIRFAMKEIKTTSYLWLANRTNSSELDWTKWSSFNF
ncbi:RNA-directed DNA polymerase, eukaryota, Reverse transcriptase zinc-binding domain protein [Artemisia annua]|uniref:RNA-directed DNA polymerase, eukaryota, Reverse transcriptase zinc-binding domain protein n=1 Tax=Artemisia annua TaxID=35608 RepID=A0A2U1KW47_ARTAN|nr:RNA-directed DNA polymerase, eukaryota, Reverse transcriptase zinc-binding domain protein [Artemisia annua]